MAITKNTKAATKATQILCSYCHRPARARIVADRQIYCGKLCAALQLVLDAYEEEHIDDDDRIAGIDPLIESLFEDRKPIPVKIRNCDIDLALDQWGDYRLDESAAAEGFPIMITIEDDGTPDWVPDPSMKLLPEPTSAEPTQDEIDRVVERLLSEGDNNKPEGRP